MTTVVSRRPHITRALIVAFCALTAVLSLVVGKTMPRAASRGHVAITTLQAGELSPIDRSQRSIDRTRAPQRERASSGPIAFPASWNAPLTSIGPLELSDALRPFTWVPWRSPAHARADLMVFLN